ncbi:MAG: aspartate aminotransferase family protein [Lawsonibacter sp.]|jgi:adenosylmethionine-8-amino-7-oxononanoate aminotransferase
MEEKESRVFYKALSKKYKRISHGEGVFLFDEDGKRYLDFGAGLAVTNIGNSVKEVIDAITDQAQKITYLNGGAFTSDVREELASRMISIAPNGMDKVFFCSGGSEAVESMAKIARQYQIECGRPSKYKIITRWQSYHGNTFGTLSLGGRPSWRGCYEDFLLHMPHIAQCNCYRCPYGLECEHCNLPCAEELERVIKYEGADTVAAFMIEPITGTTATATVPPVAYMKRIREICDQYDILLCCDEVITGLGRTGKAFAVDHFDIVPDLISVAKGLGGGYVPIGAVLASKKVVDAIANGSGVLEHSYTFAGMPIACAGANAVLKYIIENNIIQKAEENGKLLLKKLQDKLGNIPAVGDIRGKGMLLGVELVADRETKKPFDPKENISGKIASYCLEHGVIVLSGVVGTADGVAGEALQISPPLTITPEEMDFAVDVLRESIVHVTQA